MNDHDRINIIENRINILSQEMNNVKINLNTINNNVNEIRDNLNSIKTYGDKINTIINILNSRKEGEINNPFIDENGSLNNLRNPFIQAERENRVNKRQTHKKDNSCQNNSEKIDIESDNNMNKKADFSSEDNNDQPKKKVR